MNRATKLRLLCANDVYKPEKFSVLRAMKDKHQGEGITKCILGGDFLGGSLFATYSKGESMIKVCNSVGFDYIVIGNHEFDFGEDRLKELISISDSRWLGSNIKIKSSVDETKLEIFDDAVLDFDIFECGKYRIGVFGVCTASTPVLASPSPAIIFENEVNHAKDATSLLQARGCDVIIAITHVSLAIDKEIAAIEGINLIIGGHDHDPFLLLENETLIIKCGQNIEHLGIIDLDICDNPTTSKAEVRHSFQLLSTYDMPSHPEVDTIIDEYVSMRSASNEQPIQLCVVDASVSPQSDISGLYSSLSTRSCDVRVRECASVCLVADAMLYSYTSLGYNCDFALLNGGFVRGDRLYAPGSPILKSDVLNELPFEREPVLILIRGQDLQDGLKQMLAGAPRPIGSFPHMSQHFLGCYDLKQEPHSRICSIRIRGESIILDKEYRVVISDFYCSKEGDGVAAFAGKPVIHNHGRRISDVMCEYLTTLESVSGVPPGRFIELAPPSSD